MQQLNIGSLTGPPLSRLWRHREAWRKQRTVLLNAISAAAYTPGSRRVRPLAAKLDLVLTVLTMLDEIETELSAERSRTKPKYVVSSLFLHQCWRELTRTPDEHFVFITGAVVDGVSVLDQKLEFAFSKQSAVGVTGDTRSTHKLLIRLEQFRHKLLATFHSHPGQGPASIRPSGTDEHFQQRLEQAGHAAVMAIFSRDGYVRFLRLDQNLEVEIYGEGVETHEENLFRLTPVD